MGSTLNQVTIQGRLGRDPDVRFTGSGQAVANFTLATDESYKDKNGDKVKKTEWHNIVVWGKSAEYVQQYVKSGDLILIVGKLQTRSSEKDGVKKYTTEVVANEVHGVITSGAAQEGTEPQQRQAASTSRPAANRGAQSSGNSGGFKPRTQQTQSRPAEQAEPEQGPEISDEDIPF